MPIMVEGEPFFGGSIVAGIVNELDRDDVELCVAASVSDAYQRRRVCGGDPTRDGPWLMVRSEPTAQDAPPGATTLAVHDELTRATRLEADRLAELIAVELELADRADDIALLYTPLVGILLDRELPPLLEQQRDAIERLAELRSEPNARFGLYLMPPQR